MRLGDNTACVAVSLLMGIFANIVVDGITAINAVATFAVMDVDVDTASVSDADDILSNVEGCQCGPLRWQPLTQRSCFQHLRGGW